MERLTAILVVLVLALAGCGGDDEDGGDEAGSGGPTQAETAPQATAEEEDTETTETATTPEGEGVEGEPASEEDAEAIRDTVVTWLTEGGCELMSDKFLEEQSLGIGDGREERCANFEKNFQKPQFGEDDIITSDAKVGGDTASVVISDKISNVETTYELVRAGDGWQIDGTDF